MGPLHWPKGAPYYADVVFDPIGLSEIVDEAEIHGVKDMGPAKECLPDDMGPAPDQVAPVGEVSEAPFETGGCFPPK